MWWIILITVPTISLAFFLWHGQRGNFWHPLDIGGWLTSAVVLVVVLIFAAVFAGNTRVCQEKGDRLGMESEWTFWTTCMVDTPAGWFPYDQLRDIDR